MLQQTTVAAVIPYFLRFTSRWPTAQALAAAPLDDVLAAWAGLGYYARARNLHACAVAVAASGGQFPGQEADLLKLPGIGPYTAAAIAAIAFGQRAVVVDGNVDRVIARIFALETPLPTVKPEIRRLAALLTPETRAGDYAQAMMDLGATVCTPQSPTCQDCPVQRFCQAFGTGAAGQYPRKSPKATRPIRRALAFLLQDADKRIWVRRREARGLLGGMLEVPSTDWLEQPAYPTLSAAPFPAAWTILDGEVRHVFTHFELRVQVALGCQGQGAPNDGFWLADKEIAQAALPTVMKKIIRHGQGSGGTD
jgi:A/G-specific adenine glycosylase